MPSPCNDINRDVEIHQIAKLLREQIDEKISFLEDLESSQSYVPRRSELQALRYERGIIAKLASRTDPKAWPRCCACGNEGARVGPRAGDEVCDNCRSDNHD